MSAVADIFDRDGDGYIDYYEFVAALHPNKDAYKPLTDADKIEDEVRTRSEGHKLALGIRGYNNGWSSPQVTRQVAKCKCPKRFQVEQIGANKYRVSGAFSDPRNRVCGLSVFDWDSWKAAKVSPVVFFVVSHVSSFTSETRYL